MQEELQAAANEASRRVADFNAFMESAFKTRAQFKADQADKAGARAAAATSTPGVGAKAAAKTTTPGATTPAEKTTTPDAHPPWLDAAGNKLFIGYKAPPVALVRGKYWKGTPAKAPPAPQLAEQERRPAVAGVEAAAQADAEGFPAEASTSS